MEEFESGRQTGSAATQRVLSIATTAKLRDTLTARRAGPRIQVCRGENRRIVSPPFSSWKRNGSLCGVLIDTESTVSQNQVLTPLPHELITSNAICQAENGQTTPQTVRLSGKGPLSAIFDMQLRSVIK
jgi:hypothetical protein